MTNPVALQTLIQWLSPAYPVGAFSYSHGLERAVETGAVSDAQTLHSWLQSIIENGAGCSDVILLSAAFQAQDLDDVQDVATLADALNPAKERRLETLQQGASFARTTRAIWEGDLPDMAYPVAVGWAAKQHDIPLETTAYFYLHSFVSNLVSAAIRLVPLGQTEGQKCLADLAPCIETVANIALTQTLDDLGSCCFAADIAVMNHETQYTRLFRS